MEIMKVMYLKLQDILLKTVVSFDEQLTFKDYLLILSMKVIYV